MSHKEYITNTWIPSVTGKINGLTGRLYGLKCTTGGCYGGTFGHLWFHTFLWTKRRLGAFRKFKASFTALNYNKIDDIELDGIDTRDYPDFCDAYVLNATYKGREMTEKERELNF